MTDSIFSLILFICVVISGLFGLLNIYCNKKSKNDKSQPGFIGTISSLFPVLLIVFIIRSFIFAPFKIPSGSMLPTLKIGDYILVSKYAYDLRFPYFGIQLFSVSSPKRGDVVVFQSTEEFAKQNNGKKEDMIKRLVGLPGDHIRYHAKNLYINGKKIDKQFVAVENGEYDSALKGIYPYNLYSEKLGEHNFQVQNYSMINPPAGEWVVPEGMYFMMGDNRDLSDDSRYWGFVPQKNIIGKAIIVWMHWKSWSTLPNFSNDRFIR